MRMGFKIIIFFVVNYLNEYKYWKYDFFFQKILDQSVVVEMEVRPTYLVPDTNCFIGYLSQLEAISRWQEEGSSKHPYTLMVPLVVVNELEGLSQGCKPSQSLAHAALVREGAREAISFLQTKHPALRCVTTRGTVLNSTTLFEEDMDQVSIYQL
jgi:protein SMG6